MNAHYPFAAPAGTFPKTCEPHANLFNITITIYNGDDKFEILTDESDLVEIIEGRLTGAFPLCSINEMLHRTKAQLIKTTDYFHIIIC